MRFERTCDRALIADLIRSAWDRPGMFADGASLERIPIAEHAQYFVCRDAGGRAIGVVIGIQQTNACLELHICLGPRCRGRRSVEAAIALFEFLARETPYRKAIGSIPAYNKPMLWLANAAGFEKVGINGQSIMRNGTLEDQIVVARPIK